MLGDRNIYQPVTDKRRNPTSKVETDLQKKLLELKNLGSITEAEYWRLRPYNSVPASFYGLPKIHKVELQPAEDHYVLKDGKAGPIPLRPINSCIGAPTYRLSKYLSSVLKSLLEESEYTIRNARHFAEFVSNQKVACDELMVSFDVVSLFTSIPVDMAIDIVNRKLEKSDNWKSQTGLSSSQVVGLLSFVLNDSYFSFGGVQYHQVSGCAMGSPVSAIIAELVMQEIEVTALTTFPENPRWWRRYVDDSNTCLKESNIESFHQHLNSVNPCIQFTLERPVDVAGGKSIAFLDTSNVVYHDGKIEVGVYRKATHTNKYLAVDSHSPVQSKRAVVKTLMDRGRSIPSNEKLKQDEIKRVTDDLRINGYPEKLIKRIEVWQRDPSPKEKPKAFASIPYIKGVSERIRRVLGKENIMTTFKPFRTLGGVFKKPKDRPPKENLTGIVYKVKCGTCPFTYIGESKRAWSSRGAEHRPGPRGNNESAIK